MSQVLLGLDVGQKRIGVAIGNTEVALASPLTTLDHTDTIYSTIQQLAEREGAAALVVGLPRGLDGQDTAQTAAVTDFVSQLLTTFDIPINWQDEAVTSVQAEAELQARGKPYVKSDIDALAATYILQDYLDAHRQTQGGAV